MASARRGLPPAPSRDGPTGHGENPQVNGLSEFSKGGEESGGGSLQLHGVRDRERGPRLLTGDRDLAQDVAHEAFVRVAGRFGHLRTPGSFETYLRRTVINLCRDHFRRARLERAYLRREAHRPPRVETSPDPGERDELWSAVQALPYRQRAAVVLRFYEDLSEEQVGEALRCSTRAVNALVSRATENLRKRVRRER